MNTAEPKYRPFPLSIIIEAVNIAQLQRMEAMMLNCNPATSYNRDNMQVMDDTIHGVLGELVVGRVFDPKWMPFINTFHEKADVGEDIEVRSTKVMSHNLIVRDNDCPFRRYVLVICDWMKGYYVKGWCYGYEAMTDQWYENRPGERPCWKYKGELRPFKTLTLERPKDAKNEFEF